jgi:hypothetical protein
LKNWEEKVSEYLADLQTGIEELNNAPQTDEEQHEVFLLKKRIVNALVKRVTVDKSRNLEVEIRVNVLDLAHTDSNTDDSTGVQVSKDGIYTRIPDIYRAGQIFVLL